MSTAISVRLPDKMAAKETERPKSFHRVKTILNKIEEELFENPRKHPSLKGKFEGLRKIRVEDYRVIFTVRDDSVLILNISHRKDAYK